MKTFNVHYGVRVSAHDQTYPVRDFVDTFSVKDKDSEVEALIYFIRELDTRILDLKNRPGLTVTEELELIVAAADALRDAALPRRGFPVQLLLEESNDYGTVTGRVWLTVTHWADDIDRVEVASDAN